VCVTGVTAGSFLTSHCASCARPVCSRCVASVAMSIAYFFDLETKYAFLCMNCGLEGIVLKATQVYSPITGEPSGVSVTVSRRKTPRLEASLMN
jgi:hypothetical protein